MFVYNMCKYLLKTWMQLVSQLTRVRPVSQISVNLKLPQCSNPGSSSVYLCTPSRVSVREKRAGGVPVGSRWSVGFSPSRSGLVPFPLLPWSLKIFALKVALQGTGSLSLCER